MRGHLQPRQYLGSVIRQNAFQRYVPTLTIGLRDGAIWAAHSGTSSREFHIFAGLSAQSKHGVLLVLGGVAPIHAPEVVNTLCQRTQIVHAGAGAVIGRLCASEPNLSSSFLLLKIQLATFLSLLLQRRRVLDGGFRASGHGVQIPGGFSLIAKRHWRLADRLTGSGVHALHRNCPFWASNAHKVRSRVQQVATLVELQQLVQAFVFDQALDGQLAALELGFGNPRDATGEVVFLIWVETELVRQRAGICNGEIRIGLFGVCVCLGELVVLLLLGSFALCFRELRAAQFGLLLQPLQLQGPNL